MVPNSKRLNMNPSLKEVFGEEAPNVQRLLDTVRNRGRVSLMDYTLCMDIASSHRQAKNYSKAIIAYTCCLEFTNDVIGKATNLCSRGMMYEKVGDYTSAIKDFNDGKERLRVAGDTTFELRGKILLECLARVYEKLKDYNNSLVVYRPLNFG